MLIMNRLINFVLIIVTISSFAQTKDYYYDFEFYKNGDFCNPKRLKVQLVKESDTIDCPIKDEKLLLPDIFETFQLVVTFKKEKYVVEKINLSKLMRSNKIIIGIENNFSHFTKIDPITYPDLYQIPNSLVTISLKGLEQAKEVCFFVLYTELPDGKKFKKVSSLTFYSLMKTD